MRWRTGLLALALVSTAASAESSEPKPIGSPSTWIKPDDYPRQALQAAVEGDVKFTLQVDADGKVADCTVTQSSGNQSLDEASCTIITARARFIPAHDAQGRAIAGIFLSGVHWVLPDNGPIPLPPEQRVEQRVTFDVDPRGQANSCITDGQIPSWVGLIEQLCDRLPAMKILFTPQAGGRTRHVTITVQFEVSQAKP